MKSSRLFFLLSVLVIPLSTMAQTSRDTWHAVDSLQNKQYYNQAYDAAKAIYNNALKKGNSRQLLEGALYLARIGNEFMEDNSDSSLVRYKTILPKLKPVDAAICRLLLADYYTSYFGSNRFSLSSNMPSDDTDLDYTLWSIDRMRDTVDKLIRSALSDVSLLRSTSSESLGVLVSTNDGLDGNLTPTLYDVAVRKVMEIVPKMDFERIPVDKLSNPQSLFFDAQKFGSATISTVSKRHATSLFAIKTLQQWENYHRGIGDSDALMIEHYLYRTGIVPSLILFASDERDSLLLLQLPKVIGKFRKNNDSHITLLYYSLANLYNDSKRYLEAIAAIDTALALHPKSPGASRCFNLRGQITKKSVRIESRQTSTSDAYQLAVMTTRNVDHVWFRVIKNVKYERSSEENMRRFLLSRPVVKQWDIPVDLAGDYSQQHSYITIPPLTSGEYILLASPTSDFRNEGVYILHFSVADIAFLPFFARKPIQSGFVVDRTTGKPVAGLKVTLQGLKHSDNFSDITTAVTDSEGYYDFSSYIKSNRKSLDSYYNYRVAATVSGNTVYSNSHYYFDDDDSYTNHTEKNNKFFFDRPVYRPGDTIHFAFLAYDADHYNGTVCRDVSVHFVLYDINGRMVDSLRLTTDSYGLCSGSFVLASDAIPGNWSLSCDEGRYAHEYFRVEAYKQPKYTVVLSKPAEVREFGKTARIEGVAASYSAVPVNGATVSWTVYRSPNLFWRGGYQYYYRTKTKTVASGETVTNADGTFSIDFVPLPDSSINAALKPAYSYIVEVKVTDINGETHEANESLAVGYENSYVAINRVAKNVDDVAFSVACRNLDGKAIGGTATVTVDRLSVPAVPKQKLGVIRYSDSTIAMPFTKEQFEQMFPQFDYDGCASIVEEWSVQKEVFSTVVRINADRPYQYSLKDMPSGAYRMTANVVTDNGDTLEAVSYIVYEPTASKQPVRSSIITATVDTTVCEVGQTLHLRVGSRYSDVPFYVIVSKQRVCNRNKLYKVDRGYTMIDIPVDDELLGGFVVFVGALRNNQLCTESFVIEVPYTDKKLDVAFETFRDKLEPGMSEQWTLRVKQSKTNQPAAANLLITMYDKALDSYGDLGWNLMPWIQWYNYVHDWTINSSVSGFYWFTPDIPYRIVNNYTYRTVTLKQMQMYAYHRIYKSSRNIGTARGEDGMVEEELFVMDDKLDSQNGLINVAGVGQPKESTVVILDEEIENELGIPSEKEELSEKETEVVVRSNLNTLAFFRPTLRTDANGSAELRFTVPDLLTEWNIQGLAWTSDLKTGSLSAKAITQKRLMVVPNVPRFLRQGDTCIFSAKVSNMSGKEQTIAVSLQMLSAADGEALQMVVGDTLKHITLRDNASGEVSFVMVAPQHGVYVANYRLVARGENCSDGEQAPIPILPNRQLVTESMSFYINGAGEKNYDFKIRPSVEQDMSHKATLRHHSLVVDLTPNPIWMAIQSLPYVEQQKNPSNIYLANAIYTNSLSLSIVQNNPEIESMFREWEKAGTDAMQSELDRNTDLKQTVMEETPWLNDALDEEQSHRQIAQFFNKPVIERHLQKDLAKLLDAQRSDGSWCWIEGGRWPSLYTTQYILKTFGLLQQMGVQLDNRTRSAIGRAMDYVDNETYKYYKKYVKGTDFEPINLDYLYLRSLYPDNSLTKQQKEAYDFFYDNARKYNEVYRSLFSQAMLSLVFSRHGDKELACEMATRIREKALYSDEMGMYWRDNISGWCWNERPIETQAMLIRTFSEVLSDGENVARMQQWLLKQKQTTNWSSDVSTVNAIQALLLDGSKGSKNSGSTGSNGERHSAVNMHPSQMSIVFGDHILTTDTTRYLLHVSQHVEGDKITPSDGRIRLTKADDGIAWGAIYWQYFENVEKIPYSSMGISMKRTMYLVRNDGKLSKVDAGSRLKVGDKIRIRLEIMCDRNLEYLELREPRCAAFEPVSTASGWHWNSGLSFYCSVTNTAQTLYIDRMEKGTYYVEYDFYVNNAGTFTTAPTTMQSLYAPEFRSVCPFPAMHVE